MLSSKLFEKEKGNPDSHPLADCYQWALAHSDQSMDGSRNGKRAPTPMLIVSEQWLADAAPGKERYVLRRFMASQIESFGKFYHRLGSDAKRHCNEVITDGPCKAFCDFEMELSAANVAKYGAASVDALVAECERSTDALIDAMVAYHRDVHDIVDAEPIVLKAHGAHKWSRHVIFANTVWHHVTHVGNYVRHQCRQLAADYPLLRTESCTLVDTGIYHRMRCMRMYRSSKAKEPQRSLTYERGPVRYEWHINEPANRSLNNRLVLDTLITAIPLPPLPSARRSDDDLSSGEPMDEDSSDQRKFTTTSFLERFPHVLKMINMRPIQFAAPAAVVNTATGDQSPTLSENTDSWRTGVSAELMAEVRSVFGRQEPYNARINSKTGLMCIDCRSRECAIVGRAHRHNHVYVLVDLTQSRYALHCYHPSCRPTRRRWQPLPNDSFVAQRQEFMGVWQGHRTCTQQLPDMLDPMIGGHM